MKIKEYKKFLGNIIYTADIKAMDDGEERLFKGIILPKRYTQPSEEQIIEILIKTIKEVEEFEHEKIIIPKGSLHEDLILVNERIREYFKRGDEELLHFIKQKMPVHSLKIGEQPDKFLEISYGILPIEIIKAETKKIYNPVWYEKMLSNRYLKNIRGLGERLNLKILYDNNLPNRKTLDVLIENKVIISKTFSIIGNNCMVEELYKTIDFLYKNFSSLKDIESLSDISNEKIEIICRNSIKLLKQINIYKEESNVGLFGNSIIDNGILN